MDPRAYFGDIDIYLFDQLLKGRFDPSMSILDAGSGSGRNVVYFLRNGYDVCAVDQRSEAVNQVRQLAREFAPGLPPQHFSVAELTALPFPSARFDAVICSAVLHFARDEEHFTRMLEELWRVLKPGGLFFARLASTIGIEERVQPIQGRRYRLGDGTERFLVDEAMLAAAAVRLGGRLADPLKTTNVENRRAMTTWVLHREG